MRALIGEKAAANIAIGRTSDDLLPDHAMIGGRLFELMMLMWGAAGVQEGGPELRRRQVPQVSSQKKTAAAKLEFLRGYT